MVSVVVAAHLPAHLHHHNHYQQQQQQQQQRLLDDDSREALLQINGDPNIQAGLILPVYLACYSPDSMTRVTGKFRGFRQSRHVEMV